MIQKISFMSVDNSKFAFNSAPPPKPPVTSKTIDNNKILKSAAFVSSAAALAALGVAVVSLKNGRNLKKAIQTLTSNTTDAASRLEANFTGKINQLAEKAESLVTENESISKRLNDSNKWHDNWIKDVERKANNALGIRALENSINERNLGLIENLTLMQNVRNDGSRIPLDKNTKEWLNTAASRFIFKGKEHIEARPLSKNSTIWSMTAESIPEKEGGLGEVPVQIAKNMTKELGINNFLVRPMSLLPGRSKLVEHNGKFTYLYDLDKNNPYKMDVDKVAEFTTNVFRNGKYEPQRIEVFTGIDPKFGYKRLMFKNSDYFTSNGLYTDTQKVSEPERYAFFPKAVYEFQKYLLDPSSMTEIKVFDGISDIKPPDAMILNDWHAGAMAALLRLKAPVEASMSELSKDAAEAMKTMNILNINHNLDYQGTSWQHTSEILNTLFDKYAYDIYENADTGFGFDALKKVLTVDGNVNLANMAGCLSNKMLPVSPTYAFELAEQSERSHAMQHLCKTRLNQGTLEGRSNGWDREVNEVSEKNLKAFNNMLNNDKFTILKNTLRKIVGLSEQQKTELNEILSSPMDYTNFKVRLEEFRKIGSESVNTALDELESKGITKLRTFKKNTSEDTTEHILLARKHNKAMFMDYLNSMIQHNKNKENIFPIANAEMTDISHIKPEDLDDTIVFNMGVRFVGQKGVDIACNAINKVLREWETKYPGKKKPVFVIGGEDAESGKIKKYVSDLKDMLGENGKQIIHNDGFTANPVWQSGSDFTIYSGHFEPDGAKWESLYKGTPVICTRVGGQVDSVQDEINGFLTARTVPEIKSSGKDYLTEISNDLTDSIYKAVNTFYDKEAYAKMVRSSIDGNQSWIIKNKEGQITGGALIGHLKDLGFNLSDFPQFNLAA